MELITIGLIVAFILFVIGLYLENLEKGRYRTNLRIANRRLRNDEIRNKKYKKHYLVYWFDPEW